MGLIGPIPPRVDGAVKARLLELIDEAVAAGWSMAKACATVIIDRRRVWHWYLRRDSGTLDDLPPGGNPVHALLDWEKDAIVEVFNDWAHVDLSHRKLAHRGSYEQVVWVSPSSVDRVLTERGLGLRKEPRPGRSEKRPWPDWAEWRHNQLWCWDGSQFEACQPVQHAHAIVDIVSRKWIALTVSPEATHVQAKVLFLAGLEAEGLLTDEIRERIEAAERVEDLDDDTIPMLLAISDNGSEMRAHQTRQFLALCSIAQHFGRPGTPTDQAWIETLWGHIKQENPHLCQITDPKAVSGVTA